MDVGQARQARHLLVQARVVLHGAGAEREDSGIDSVILLRKPGEVANDLRLGETGQAQRRGALETAQAILECGRLGKINAGATGRILLEDQRLFELQRLVAGEGRDGRKRVVHRTASTIAPAKVIISSLFEVSVTANTR